MVVVAMRLIDVDLETGPTGVWLGSHRLEYMTSVQVSDMVAIPWQRGDCMLMDYRLLHAGLPNRSLRPRPVLYLVYGRRWFADDVNHISRIPLDMTLERYQTLPESAHQMLIRAYTHAVRLRWPEADLPTLATERDNPPLPSPLVQPVAPAAVQTAAPHKPGRNEPCPCGSGKKFKHCHGQNV
jgi:ectoine hydroxylase-related dioxygenase (phytanoyl-CoA dioxygenase family)